MIAKVLENTAEYLQQVEDVVTGAESPTPEELWDLGIEDTRDPLASWIQNSVYDIQREGQAFLLLLAGGGPTVWLEVHPNGGCWLRGSWAFEEGRRAVDCRELGRQLWDYLDEVYPR